MAGRPPDEYGIEPTRFTEMRPGCFDIHQRVRDMNPNRVLAVRLGVTLARHYRAGGFHYRAGGFGAGKRTTAHIRCHKAPHGHSFGPTL